MGICMCLGTSLLRVSPGQAEGATPSLSKLLFCWEYRALCLSQALQEPVALVVAACWCQHGPACALAHVPWSAVPRGLWAEIWGILLG